MLHFVTCSMIEIIWNTSLSIKLVIGSNFWHYLIENNNNKTGRLVAIHLDFNLYETVLE